MKRLLPPAIGTLALALVLALGSGGSTATAAVEVELGLDVDTAGNSALSLGSHETCAEIASVGDTFDVDAVVRGIPPFDPETWAGGVAGVQFMLNYDPAVVKVIGLDTELMLTADADPPPLHMSFSDPVPDADGAFGVAAVDLSGSGEDGDGVLARLTLEAIGEGGTILDITPDGAEALVVDPDGGPYALSFLADAEVVVGGPCTGGVLDNDGDGFGDGLEQFVVTAALRSCPQTAAMNDETVDAWPPDFNDNGSVEVSDLLGMGTSFKSSFGSGSGDGEYAARFDLNASSNVDVNDLLGGGASFKSSFGSSCGP